MIGPQPAYVLVTFIVSEDGEPLKPMSEYIARVPLDDTGGPASLDTLNERVTRAIKHRWGTTGGSQ